MSSAATRPPLYVDIAVRRWQNLTGRDAVRLSDGKLFREIEADRENNQDTPENIHAR
jgi:hypothetical protein